MEGTANDLAFALFHLGKVARYRNKLVLSARCLWKAYAIYVNGAEGLPQEEPDDPDFPVHLVRCAPCRNPTRCLRTDFFYPTSCYIGRSPVD